MTYRLATSLVAILIGMGTGLGSAAVAQELPEQSADAAADRAKSINPSKAYRKWLPWVELGGVYGTDDASRGEVTLFAPVAQTNNGLAFIEARGKFYEQDQQELNFALGYRMMHSSGWNFGAWGAVDGRITEADNKFWQFAGGLEALSDRWDLRVNGYLPVSDPKSAPSLATFSVSGNGILMTGAQEVPLHGVDGEVGVKVFDWQYDADDDSALLDGLRTELRLFAGGFYFNDDDAAQEIAGFRGRAEFRLENIIPAIPGSRLTFETEFSHDDVRDDKWEIGARLRIPLGKTPESRAVYAGLTPQEQRMTEALERDTDIMTGATGTENVFDNATDVALNQVAFGTDQASLDVAIGQGANTLIIVQGTGAPIDVTTLALQTDQTLQGGGSTIQLRGASTGVVADFTAPGQAATLHNGGGGTAPLVLLSSNNHVAGLDLDIAQALGGSEGEYVGIYGAGGTQNANIAITDINIHNSGAAATGAGTAGSDGIVIRDGADIMVANVMIDGVLGDGLNFFAVDGASISNVHIDGASRAGMLFGAGANNINVSDFSITNAGFAGLSLFNSSNFTVANGTISGTGVFSPTAGKAINMDNMMTASFTNMTVSDSTELGLNARKSTGISISGSSFDNQETGIRFQNTSGSVTNTTITNSSIAGMRLQADNGRVVTVDLSGVAFGDGTTPLGLNLIGKGTINVSGTGNTSTAVTACIDNTFMGGVVNGTVSVNATPCP